MTKTILLRLALLALLIVAPAGAQTNLGVIGGLNIADLHGKDVDGDKIDFSSRTAMGVGGLLEIGLGEKVALRFEPMYLQKGGEFDEIDADLGAVKFSTKTADVEVPILLKLDLSSTATRPYLIAGPTIGIIVTSKIELSAPGVSAEIDIDEITKSTELAFTLGGGVSFPAGKSVLFLEGRYAFGLTDIVDDGAVDFMGERLDLEADIKTKGLQIMGGIAFPLSSK